MLNGIVKSYSDLKGYGFIVDENGKEYFAHVSKIVGEEERTLTVIRICVPKQDELSYCGEDVYIRQYNNTVKLETAKEILAVNKIFVKG